MRILIADKFPEEGLEHLRLQGHEVTFDPDLTGPDLVAAVPGHDVLVVRSTKVEAEVIAAADSLSLIVRAGAGTNTIDKQAAAARAIYVSNVPGQNAVAVAELTLGLILAIDRRIPDNVVDLRADIWNKAAYSKASGLMGRRLGVVGMGAIGLAVALRAAAFGLELHTLDKRRDAATAERVDELGFELHADLPTLAASVDILSFHVPATSDTRHLVNAALLSVLRPGTVLINTSRADVVDEPALLAAIDERDLWVGVDVLADEPSAGTGEVRSALARHPRVYATHHIGASTAQAQQAVAAGVLEVVDAFDTGTVLNCVNLQPRVPDTTTITVRHRDRVGVLANLLMLIRDADINVKTMSNLVFQGQEAATATLDLKGAITEDLLDQLRALPNVFHVRINA
ncbi:MAG: NAD(P)-binding domain-containing protein [Acidimicrobiia bacterium]|nr:NAD(P)-binding domain-containing protein [Acidimicrobiia bacterium]